MWIDDPFLREFEIDDPFIRECKIDDPFLKEYEIENEYESEEEELEALENRIRLQDEINESNFEHHRDEYFGSKYDEQEELLRS